MKKVLCLVILATLFLSLIPPKAWGWAGVPVLANHHGEMTRDALLGLVDWGLWTTEDIGNIPEYANNVDKESPHCKASCHRVRKYQDIFQNYGGEICTYAGAECHAAEHINKSRYYYAIGNIAEAQKHLGYAIHYIQDAACPPHVFPFREEWYRTNPYRPDIPAHTEFESYANDMYGFRDWPQRVRNAPIWYITGPDDLRNKIIELADMVAGLHCSYVAQNETIIGVLPSDRDWDMSDADIGFCMEKAASLVKGAAIWARCVYNLDLIFAIDVTGSMWDDIAEVKVSASQIVEAIASKVTGYRIAVVSYRDFPVYPYGNPGDWPYKDVLSFSTQKTEIIAAIQSLVVGGGADWEESVYSALMHCIDASTLGGWRTGANKFIILMGDAPPHDPEPFTGYTLNDVINAAEEADPVAIYPIVIGPDPNTYTYFSNLAEGTNGKVFTAATASEVPDTIIEAIEVIIDTEPPSINIEVPQPGDALQDGVTLKATVSDPSGVEWVTFSIREPNGELGNIIDPLYESMPATHIGDDTWQLLFDTTQLPDGYYILLVNASDTLGNEGYATVAFSIRNWAVLELLPATPNNKAGRTMPIKFALRVAASVDPNQPFIYNEELTIKIYATDDPSNILQISTFGDKARDYRINTVAEHYITNFQTLKIPKTYTVEIWRKNMLIGSFSFQTVK